MSRAFSLLLLGLGVALLVVLLQTAGIGELRVAIGQASPTRFAAFLVLTTAVFTTYAVRWKRVLQAVSATPIELSLPRLLAYRACEHAASTLVPAAHLSGEPLRALLLRRRGVDWTTAAASVAMDRIVEATASSIAGPIYVVVFFTAGGGAHGAAPWAFAGMLAAVAGLTLFYVQVLRGGTLLSWLGRRGFFATARGSLEEVERRLAAFVRSREFLVALALSLVAEILIIAELSTLMAAFALPLPLPLLVGVMVGMGVAQVVPIPAAVGSLEATQVGILTLAGHPANLGLAVGLVIRLRETLWIAVGLIALWFEGSLGRMLPTKTRATNGSDPLANGREHTSEAGVSRAS